MKKSFILREDSFKLNKLKSSNCILKKSNLERLASERSLKLGDIMYINISKLKSKVFLGSTRAYLLETYYEVFYNYEGRPKKKS